MTSFLNARIEQPVPAALQEAAQLLRDGQLVAFPTETVYGLGADATNGEAVARIFAAKGRPQFNPLITHIAGLDTAESLGQFSKAARQLAEAFWPGPLTLVVMRTATCPISELVSAGLPTLALRVPDHPVAQSLLREAGLPLAAPSANRSGHVSATRADHVVSDLGKRVSMILDGGPTAHGIESTVIDATTDDPALLRPGAIPTDAIETLLGRKLTRSTNEHHKPKSPGQLESHYAPSAALRLNATTVQPGEALLAFGPNPILCETTFNLSPRGDSIEAAANLFAALRKLDATGATSIAVMPIPETGPNAGLGEAINDRLRRAAAPRS